MCIQLSDVCTREFMALKQEEATEDVSTPTPLLTPPLPAALPTCLNFLHPNCNDLCPPKLYCPREKKPFCPRYNTCRPHLTALTIARLLAAAKSRFVGAGYPDSWYNGLERVPEDDPEFLLGWLGRDIFQSNRENNMATDAELNKLFPGTRETPFRKQGDD
jgi:hypothetical protein